jgi:hypothetical protein
MVCILIISRESMSTSSGGTLVIVGAAVDIASIVVASKPIRRAAEVVGAWALAWAGCKAVGVGERAGGIGYDWAQTTFYAVPQLAAP